MADNKSSSSQQGTVKDPAHDGRLKENREAGVTKGTTEASAARSHEFGGKHSGSKSDSSHESGGKHASSKSDSSHEGKHSASHDSKSQESKSGGSKSEGSKSEGSKSGSSKSEASKSSASDDADLKSREYTDADGNVHHHTKTYQEQHKG